MPTMRSGLSAQFGFKAETTWGAGVLVDRFLPMLSESMDAKKGRLDSDSIYAGRLVRDSEQWDEGAIEAGGSIELDVYTFGMGLLWKHALGSAGVTGAGPYVHTFTPGSLDGLGLTIQIGKPDRGGTVRPWNFLGCKTKSWELSVDAGSAAKLKLDYSARDPTRTGRRPSRRSLLPRLWLGSSSRTRPSRPFTARARRSRACRSRGRTGSRTIVSSSAPRRPTSKTRSSSANTPGEAAVEFANETLFDAFWAGTEADVALTLTRGAASLAITGNTRLDGAAPVVEGRGKLTQKIPFVFVGDGTDADAMTIVATNTDATA